MALETGTYVNDLVPANPPGTDAKSQGDDHLRLIKTALKNCFAGFTGAVLITGTDGGAANAYTVTPTPALVGYVSRMFVAFSPTIQNTGASTINISGLGVKDLKSVSGTALVAGDLVVGVVYLAVYNGTEFRLTTITKKYADDLAFNTALPAQALGFLRSDGTTAAFTKKHTGYAQDEVKGADIASAATVDLQSATGNLTHITGTTTITAFTLDSGAEREIVFDGALTLTHNATTLILPTGANITTAAGDCATVRGDGTGNARVVKYLRADGRALTATVPGMVLIATITPTVAANVDALSVFTSTYDDYLIIADGLCPSADDNLLMRFANAGVVDTGNNYYGAAAGTATDNTAGAFMQVAGNVYNAGRGLVMEVHVSNVNDTTTLKNMQSLTTSQSNSTPTYTNSPNWGAYSAANAISGFRFYWAVGANFKAQGSIKIYGISKV